MRDLSIRAALLSAILLALAGYAQASSISITNPGFEANVTSTTVGGPITGWTTSGTGGVGSWNINTFPAGYWTVPAPEGNQIAYLSDAPAPGSPSSIAQTLVDTLQPNTLYTLTGMVGHPIGFGAGLSTIYTAQLLAGTNVLATYTGTGPDGTFINFNAGLAAFDSTGSAFVGQSLGIQLSSNHAQTGFDQIALVSTAAVPEPSTWLLLATGTLGLLGLGWRKRPTA